MVNRGHVEVQRSINSRIAFERRPRCLGGCQRGGATRCLNISPHSSNDPSALPPSPVFAAPRLRASDWHAPCRRYSVPPPGTSPHAAPPSDAPDDASCAPAAPSALLAMDTNSALADLPSCRTVHGGAPYFLRVHGS